MDLMNARLYPGDRPPPRAGGLGPWLSLVTLALACWLVDRALRGSGVDAVVLGLEQTSRWQIVLAVVLTTASHAVRTGHNQLALRHVGRRAQYRDTALASFVSAALGRGAGIGPGLVASGLPRLPIDGDGAESEPLDTTRLLGFAALTVALGGAWAGGVALLLAPQALLSVAIPAGAARLFGILLLLPGLAYLALAVVRRRPLVLRDDIVIDVPSLPIAAAQVALGIADWLLMAAALWVLLPASVAITPVAFVAVFVLATVAGIASGVPGGLVVFESVVLAVLASPTTAPALLAALLVFRLISGVLPVLVALLVLGGVRLARRGSLARLGDVLGRSIPLVAPRLLAVTTFLAGVLLLATGALPARAGRLDWLAALPLPAIELSHFLASLAGMGLVLLAHALQNRLDAAWLASVVLLAAGAALALLRGLHWEEALLLLGALAALVPARPLFYRRAQVLRDLFSPGWIVAVAAALGGTVWLGMFAYRHVDYAHELWWEFALFSDAPRFLRASVGVVGLAIGFAVAHLLRTAPARPTPPDAPTMEHVRAIVAASPSAMASLALLGDKSFLIDDGGRAFVMFATGRSCWVAMGDPVGPVAERTELVWRFRELCDHADVYPVFYEVTAASLPLYLDVGLTPFKFGECARVDLTRWSLDGPKRKGTRYVLKRQERDGSTFEVVPPAAVPAIAGELRAVSDSWLAKRNTREKGFSLGAFSEAYVASFPVGIVRRDGRIVAFTNLWCAAEHEEVAPDLMRYAADAPADAMEFLFAHVMLWAQAEGYRWFNLGMAPLAGLEGRALAPFWQRAGAFAYRHGEHFYNFQGVRRYKQQFDPEWEPRYLVAPGGLVLPRVLANVATLVSGGLKGLVSR